MACKSLRRFSSDFDSREAATEGTVAQGEPTSVSEIGLTLGTLVRPHQGSRPSRFFGGYAAEKTRRAGASGDLFDLNVDRKPAASNPSAIALADARQAIRVESDDPPRFVAASRRASA